MRSVQLTIPELAVFFLATISALSAERASAAPPDATNDRLWAAHAAYQTSVQRDYVTPVIVRAILAEARRTPRADYDQLVREGLRARAAFREQLDYASAGSYPSQLTRERQIVTWARRAADVAKHPLATSIATSAELMVDTADLVSKHLTALDAGQQQELQDLNYRKASRRLTDTYSDALTASRANPRLRTALNTFLGPTIGVEIGEGADSILAKSPALVAALGTQRIEEALRAGASPSTLEALKEQYDTIMSQASLSYDAIAQAEAELAEASDAIRRQVRQEELRRAAEERRAAQAEQVEAARASINALAAIIGLRDPAEGQRVQIVGDSLVRTWENLQKYSDLSLDGSPTTFAKVALMANWMSAAITIMSALGPQQADSSAIILEQLNEIKRLIGDLYTMTEKRFDRLELILESYQRATMQALRALLIQGALTADAVDQVRDGLTAAREDLQDIRLDLEANLIAQYNNTYLDYQRTCYVERLQLVPVEPLDKQGFDRCISKFLNYALDVSRSRPFTDLPFRKPAESMLAAKLAGGPYSALNLLTDHAYDLVIYERAPRTPIGNPIVWSNASVAVVSTMAAWPNLVTPASRARLDQLINRGTEELESIRRVGSPSGGLVPAPLFGALLNQLSDRILTVGKEMNGVAVAYASTIGNVNPFSVGLQEISPAIDPTVEASLPARVPKCDPQDKDLPETIDRPAGLSGRFEDFMRVANRLDPASHAISLCYTLAWEDPRVYLHIQGDRYLPFYFYFGRPVLRIYVTQKDTEEQQLYLSGTLPDMVYGYAPVHDPLPDHAENTFVGEFRGEDQPPSLKWADKRFPWAFQQWLAGDGPGKFSTDCWRSWKTPAGVRTQEKIYPRGVRSFTYDPKLPTFVEQELDRHRRLVSLKVLQEAIVESRLRRSLAALSNTKRLLDAYLRICFPISAKENLRLASVMLRELQVYDGNYEWESLTESVEQRTFRDTWWNHQWFAWSRAPHKPGDMLSSEQIIEQCVAEMAAMGRVGSLHFGMLRRIEELRNVVHGQAPREDDPMIIDVLDALRVERRKAK